MVLVVLKRSRTSRHSATRAAVRLRAIHLHPKLRPRSARVADLNRWARKRMTTQSRHSEVSIDLRQVHDWPTFHSLFKQKMGFPDFYGQNLDAWIDCMTAVDAPEEKMSSVHAPLGGVLVIVLQSVGDFKKRCPEIFEALVDCVAFVNHRRIERGDSPVLSLSYYA